MCRQANYSIEMAFAKYKTGKQSRAQTEFLALFVHLFVSCGGKMLPQLLIRAFLDQVDHVFDPK